MSLKPPALASPMSSADRSLSPDARRRSAFSLRSDLDGSSGVISHRQSTSVSDVGFEWLHPAYRESRPLDRVTPVFLKKKSFCQRFFGAIVTFISSLFSITLWFLLLPLLLVVWLVQKMGCCFLCCASRFKRIYPTRFGACLSRMSAADSMWILRESETSPSIGQLVLILEKGLGYNRIRDLVLSRIVQAEDRNHNLLYPRFSQKIVRVSFGYAWEKDEHFSIDEHFQLLTNEFIQNQIDLEEYLSQNSNVHFNPKKSPWQLIISEEYGDECDTILIFRYHFALSDGISLIHLFTNNLVDNNNSPSSRSIQLRDHFWGKRRSLSILQFIFLTPLYSLFHFLSMSDDVNLLHIPHLSQQRIVAISEPFSFGSAFRIKTVARSTLHQLILTIMASSLRKYLQREGITNPFDLRVVYPVDIRSQLSTSASVPMGNQMTFLLHTLPVSVEGTIPRLWEIKESTKNIKLSSNATVIRWLLTFFHDLLPASAFRWFFDGLIGQATCVLYNVPIADSSLTTLLLGSREVKSIIALAPPMGSCALSYTVTSYADDIRVGVMVDRRVIPDPYVLVQDFNREMNKLFNLLAHRRIPGDPRTIIRGPTSLPKSPAASSLPSVETPSPNPGNLTIESIQEKLVFIQKELQTIRNELETCQSASVRNELFVRVERKRVEFQNLMFILRDKKAEEEVLESDDEDELDFSMRKRLRSESIGSRRSISSGRTGSSCSNPHRHSPTDSQADWDSRHYPSPPHTPTMSSRFIQTMLPVSVRLSQVGSGSSDGTVRGSFSPHVEQKQYFL